MLKKKDGKDPLVAFLLKIPKVCANNSAACLNEYIYKLHKCIVCVLPAKLTIGFIVQGIEEDEHVEISL